MKLDGAIISMTFDALMVMGVVCLSVSIYCVSRLLKSTMPCRSAPLAAPSGMSIGVSAAVFDSLMDTQKMYEHSNSRFDSE
jgi:hypothetical protein